MRRTKTSGCSTDSATRRCCTGRWAASELRDLVHDHLDPRGLPDVVLHRVQQRRPDRDLLGMAARRPDEHDRLARDGGDRLRPTPPPAACTTGRPSSGELPGAGSQAGSTSSVRSPSPLRSATGSAIFLTTLLNFWFDYPNTKEWTLLMYGIVMLIAVAGQPASGVGSRRS